MAGFISAEEEMHILEAGMASNLPIKEQTLKSILKDAAKHLILEVSAVREQPLSERELAELRTAGPSRLKAMLNGSRITLRDLDVLPQDRLEEIVEGIIPSCFFAPLPGHLRKKPLGPPHPLVESAFETEVGGTTSVRKGKVIFDVRRFYEQCEVTKGGIGRYTGIRFGCTDGAGDLAIVQDVFYVIVDKERTESYGTQGKLRFYALIRRLTTGKGRSKPEPPEPEPEEQVPKSRGPARPGTRPGKPTPAMGAAPARRKGTARGRASPLRAAKARTAAAPKKAASTKAGPPTGTPSASTPKSDAELSPLQKTLLDYLKEGPIFGNEFYKRLEGVNGIFIRNALKMLVKREKIGRITFYKDRILFYRPEYECHAQLLFQIYKRHGVYKSELDTLVQDMKREPGEVKTALAFLIKKERITPVSGEIDGRPEEYYYFDETLSKVVAALFINGPLFPNEISVRVGTQMYKRTLAPLTSEGRISAVPVLNGANWQDAYYLPHDEWLAKILEYVGVNIPTLGSDVEHLASKIRKSTEEVKAGAALLVERGRMHCIEATRVRNVQGETTKTVEQIYFYSYNKTAANTVAYLYKNGPAFPGAIAKDETVGTSTSNLLSIAKEYTGKKKIKTKEIKRLTDTHLFFHLPLDENLAQILLYIGEHEPVYEPDIIQLASLLKCTKEEVQDDLAFLRERGTIGCIEATRVEKPGKEIIAKVYFLYNGLPARVFAALHENGPLFQLELVEMLETSTVLNYYLESLIKKRRIRRLYLSRGKSPEALVFLPKDLQLAKTLEYLGECAMMFSYDILKLTDYIKSDLKRVEAGLSFLVDKDKLTCKPVKRVMNVGGRAIRKEDNLYYLYNELGVQIATHLYAWGPKYQPDVARLFNKNIVYMNKVTTDLEAKGIIKRLNVSPTKKPKVLLYLPLDEERAQRTKDRYIRTYCGKSTKTPTGGAGRDEKDRGQGGGREKDWVPVGRIILDAVLPVVNAGLHKHGKRGLARETLANKQFKTCFNILKQKFREAGLNDRSVIPVRQPLLAEALTEILSPAYTPRSASFSVDRLLIGINVGGKVYMNTGINFKKASMSYRLCFNKDDLHPICGSMVERHVPTQRQAARFKELMAELIRVA